MKGGNLASQSSLYVSWSDPQSRRQVKLNFYLRDDLDLIRAVSGKHMTFRSGGVAPQSLLLQRG
jgi:hypothetical protein